MVPQGGGEGEGGVTTLGGEGEGGLPLHLPAAEEVGHCAPHQVAGGSHYTCLDILAWYFCLKQALVFSNRLRGVDVARICQKFMYMYMYFLSRLRNMLRMLRMLRNMCF